MPSKVEEVAAYPGVRIERQPRRKHMMMRVDPAGHVIVSIPLWLSLKDPRLIAFIRSGLDRLRDAIPERPQAPLHDAAAIRGATTAWAARIGVVPGRVQLREMSRKWGSCSKAGNITFNTALYYVPWPLVEYIIVHELVHLLVFDHSPAFWQAVEAHIPDCRERDQAIKQYRV